MRWTRQERSNIEDRRGQKPGLPGAAKIGGGIGGIVAILLALLLGKDYLGGGEPRGGAAQGGGAAADPDAPLRTSAAEERLVDFINFALKDQQDTWREVLGRRGQRYRETTLVLYREGTPSGCGYGDAAIGPFYCPGDGKVYVDLSFYEQLDRRFGAPGDFAQAYVLAHEVGHHIQNLLGTDDEVRRKVAQDRRAENALSVRQELQADCYAGVWGHYAAQRELLEPGDLDEGLAAATAIGDDALQRQAGARVNPERWTHGSSRQRVTWFRRGFDSGDVASCDTFAATAP